MHQEDNQIPSSGPELESFQNDLLITFNPGQLHLPQEGFNIFSAQAYRANSEVQPGTPERQKSPSRNTSSSGTLPQGEVIATSSRKMEEPKKLRERMKPRNVSCQKRLFGVAERFDWEDYDNDPEFKQRAQMLKNHRSLFEQEDHRKTFISSAFLLNDHKAINIIVPDVLPQIHSQISDICGPEQYLKFHPWSITNPSRKAQPQTKERIFLNQMLDIYFKVSNTTNQLMEMEQGQNEEQSVDRFYSQTLEGSLQMFNDSNRRNPFQNLQNMSPATRFMQNYSADQKNLAQLSKRPQKSRQKSSDQENEYKSASRTVFVEVFEQKKTQNSKPAKEKNRHQKNKPSKSQPKTSINSNISPTLPFNFTGNRSGSTNDNSTSKKNSSDTNSTNATKRNRTSVPQVSEFKISEFDKPFSMKYTISFDSYEESSWKWFFNRMKNGINRKYTGSVYFEKFSSWSIAERVILEDFLYRNEKVRRLCNQSRKTDQNVLFETLFDSKTGDTDMKALVVLPLQLKLPEGYSYSYQSYRDGDVWKLSIENEHASIRYFDKIKFGRKDEGRRDLRKKLKLEKNRVWIGDEILRQQAIVTFKNPLSRKVSIESNHPEHIYYRESITTKNDIQRMETCYSTVQTEEGPLMKTICWGRDPNYKEIPLRFKLKVLAFYAACFIIANLINAYFPASKV